MDMVLDAMRIVMHQACAVGVRAARMAVRASVVVRAALLVQAGMVALAWAAPAAPAGGSPVAAGWKERHVEFFYRGRTARYSGEGLRDKVRALLLDLGARRDATIVPLGCEDGVRPRPSAAGPRLSITFSAPALPDPAAKPVRAGDLAATDARFDAFSITIDAFRNMGIGDCELVEQFARQILPKLTTREVRQDITCVPNQLSGSHFMVRGEVLRPLPPGEAATRRSGTES